MDNDFLAHQDGNSRLHFVYRSFRQTMVEILSLRPEEVTPERRFDQLIPRAQRRRCWRALQNAGRPLPNLGLSNVMLYVVAFLVVAHVAALVFLFNWTAIFNAIVLGLLGRSATRPLAVHPPRGCRTIEEAVVCITPFSREDYKAGLWPPEAIAAKVRWLVAWEALLPMDAVTDETRLKDVFG